MPLAAAAAPSSLPVNKTELFLSGLFLFLSKLQLHPGLRRGRAGRREQHESVPMLKQIKTPLKIIIIIIMIVSEEFAVT